MATRYKGKQMVETVVRELVCDQCGKVIDDSSPMGWGERIGLQWGVLGCWLDDSLGDLDGSADLCSVDCLRALVDRVEAFLPTEEP